MVQRLTSILVRALSREESLGNSYPKILSCIYRNRISFSVSKTISVSVSTSLKNWHTTAFFLSLVWFVLLLVLQKCISLKISSCIYLSLSETYQCLVRIEHTLLICMRAHTLTGTLTSCNTTRGIRPRLALFLHSLSSAIMVSTFDPSLYLNLAYSYAVPVVVK